MEKFKKMIAQDARQIEVFGRDYSIRPIVSKLSSSYNATDFGKAVDLILTSEQGLEPSNNQRHIELGDRISKYQQGIIYNGIFTHKHDDPGSPDSLVGFIESYIETTRDLPNENTKFDDGVKFIEALYPSIGSGPHLMGNLDEEVGTALGLHLVDYAATSFDLGRFVTISTMTEGLRVHSDYSSLGGLVLQKVGLEVLEFESQYQFTREKWYAPKRWSEPEKALIIPNMPALGNKIKDLL